MCWIVPLVVDVRSVPGHEVHFTSSRRSHTHSVFGLEWTAGRVVSVPWHNRSCTVLVVLVAVVALSSCLQVCRSKLQIHVRRSKQVTWQFIRSFLLYCIPSCIRDQCNRHISRFFVCCVPSDRTCAHCNVWCASVAKAALHHNTLRVSSVCSPSDVCQGVRLDHRKLDHADAIPDSTALLLLSHSPRQMFCCPSVSDRVKHEVVAPRVRRPALIGLEGSAVGYCKPK